MKKDNFAIIYILLVQLECRDYMGEKKLSGKLQVMLPNIEMLKRPSDSKKSSNHREAVRARTQPRSPHLKTEIYDLKSHLHRIGALFTKSAKEFISEALYARFDRDSGGNRTGVVLAAN